MHAKFKTTLEFYSKIQLFFQVLPHPPMFSNIKKIDDFPSFVVVLESLATINRVKIGYYGSAKSSTVKIFGMQNRQVSKWMR